MIITINLLGRKNSINVVHRIEVLAVQRVITFKNLIIIVFTTINFISKVKYICKGFRYRINCTTLNSKTISLLNTATVNIPTKYLELLGTYIPLQQLCRSVTFQGGSIIAGFR